MKKIFLNTGNLILKGSKKDSKTKVMLDTLRIVKMYNINGKDFIYINNAIHTDGLTEFLENYKNFDIDIIIPTGVVGEKNSKTLTTKSFGNMKMVYRETKLENDSCGDPSLIFCNEEKISLDEIKFILNDIKESKELKDMIRIFKKFLSKGMTIEFEERDRELFKSIQDDLGRY
ncbi:hypothetical protein JJB71_13060 [Clostridium perfringens]|uniref:hypothetical protein n=1 Tax=Clostridium perfringens TaxID=1502 RepID=UPI001ABA2B62|nr:hypothetical protein [Clostridium perfringens]MBO3398468.1 hypothetical protein [Clostridium perfringens]